MLSRALNVVIVLLLVLLAGLLVARVARRGGEPPSFEELHRAAEAALAAGRPDALPALERAVAAIEDREAAELYLRGIAFFREGRRDLAEAALSRAARRESERWSEP